MSAQSPSRRTLVKGAAWSVPVVALGGAAPAFAASPCISLRVACEGGRLVFYYTLTRPVTSAIVFNFTIGRPATQGNDGVVSNEDGVYTPATAEVTLASPTFPGERRLVSVTRSSNEGKRTYTVSVKSGPCVSNTVSGNFTGQTCGTGL